MLSKKEKLTICRFLDQRFSKLPKLPSSIDTEKNPSDEIKKRYNLLDYELAKLCAEKFNMKLRDVIDFIKSPDFHLNPVVNVPQISPISLCTHIVKKDQTIIMLPKDDVIKFILITRTHLNKNKLKIKEESIIISKSELKKERENIRGVKVPLNTDKEVFHDLILFKILREKYDPVIERDSEIPIEWEEYQLEFELKNKIFIPDTNNVEWIQTEYGIFDNRPKKNKKTIPFTSLYLAHLDKENAKIITRQLLGQSRKNK